MKASQKDLFRHCHYPYLLLLVLIGSLLLQGTALAAKDHSTIGWLRGPFPTASHVTQVCLRCHEDESQEMMATTHWTWEYETKDGQKLGKNNVINNYCVAVASNWPRCTSCHVGYGYKNPEEFVKMDETKVDCLVCHDTTGTYKKFPTGSGEPAYEAKMFPGGPGAPYAKPWSAVDLVAAAQSVGKPSRKNCGACHFNGGGGPNVKHGDLDNSLIDPNRMVDVHMSKDGADYTCQDCHQVEANEGNAWNPKNHQIAGSRYEMDLHGETHMKTCKTCHGEEPHEDSATLNRHTDKIACQTCHIPVYAKEEYVKTWWDWSTAGDLEDGTGDFEGQKVWKVVKDPNGNKIYMSPKGDFVWERELAPGHTWFNGNTKYITLDDEFDPNEVVAINQMLGDIDDPNAVIFPYHAISGKQPYDAGTNKLVVPNLFPTNLETAYWKNWDWGKAIAGGQASVGREFSGEYGFVETVMYWPLTHMVSPADQALNCQSCHTPSGALDFTGLGYSTERVEDLTSMFPALDE